MATFDISDSARTSADGGSGGSPIDVENGLEAKLEARKAELAAREAELAARERRIHELEAMLVARESSDRAQIIYRETAESTASRALTEAQTILTTAELASGSMELGEAHELTNTAGLASVGEATLKIDAVRAKLNKDTQADALIAVKNAAVAVRDVFALRCHAQSKRGDRDSFLANAEEAFGSERWDTELKALILLAYHKVAKKMPEASAGTFLSNNQLDTARRGRPRPRRRRDKSPRHSSVAPLLGPPLPPLVASLPSRACSQTRQKVPRSPIVVALPSRARSRSRGKASRSKVARAVTEKEPWRGEPRYVDIGPLVQTPLPRTEVSPPVFSA